MRHFVLPLKVALSTIPIVVMLFVLKTNTRPEPSDFGFIKKYKIEWKWKKEHLPIKILVDPSVTETMMVSVAEAVQHINYTVGNTVFLMPRRVKTHITGCVSISRRPSLGKFGGVTHHMLDAEKGYIDNAWIELYQFNDARINYFVALHELLHALGMDHDKDENSILFSNIHSPLQKITEHDLNLLRETYGR